LLRRATFEEKSNSSERGSIERFGLVGVDAWSNGCVDVRFSGVAERGVRGECAGSELDDLTGVRKAGFADDMDEEAPAAEPDGVDGRVDVLGCSSKRREPGRIRYTLEEH
jgi:hypothetical protein